MKKFFKRTWIIFIIYVGLIILSEGWNNPLVFFILTPVMFPLIALVMQSGLGILFGFAGMIIGAIIGALFGLFAGGYLSEIIFGSMDGYNIRIDVIFWGIIFMGIFSAVSVFLGSKIGYKMLNNIKDKGNNDDEKG